MELDKNEFKDKVVYDLINFINLKVNSDKDLEMWHSTWESSEESYLNQLFDDSECLRFYKYAENNIFVNIGNKKLLRISSVSPMYNHIDRIHGFIPIYYNFALYNNISNIKVLLKENHYIDEENQSIEILNENDSLLFNPINGLNRTKEDFITDDIMKLIKPVNLEELMEKGKKKRVK